MVPSAGAGRLATGARARGAGSAARCSVVGVFVTGPEVALECLGEAWTGVVGADDATARHDEPECDVC